MTEKPREWTLDWQMGPARVTGPKELSGDKSVAVVELEPMLDLLEDLCRTTLSGSADFGVREEAEDLLRDHDRLGGPDE
jgi:hypothetical protein